MSISKTAISIAGVVGWTTSYTSRPSSISRDRNFSTQPHTCINAVAATTIESTHNSFSGIYVDSLVRAR
jgi:hypothetical protein